MQLPTVYEDSFLVSGIMCFGGCGYNIETSIREYLEIRFPKAKIYISSGPMPYGMHKYVVEIQAAEQIPITNLTIDIKKVIIAADPERFTIVDENPHSEPKIKNWLNILINFIAITSIIVLSIIFPPSLLLSIGLGAICFSATLFTARDYILNFLKSLSSKNFLSMQVTVSFGWLLALAHAIYHVSLMPLMTSFAMTFMNFVMPLTLVTIVNVMDEIKRQIQKKSQKIYLNGIKSLFPEMQEEYLGMQVTQENAENLVNSTKYIPYARHTICKNMFLKVKAGECFPVDGQIVFGSTYVDKSILNGEPAIASEVGTRVESGCINLWQDVVILTEDSEYYSTANKMIMYANTQDKQNTNTSPSQLSNKFYYFYFGLFGAGFILSIVLACVLGTFTVGTLLQSMIGILFAICPCTIGISYYLPNLLKNYQLNNDDIIINNPNPPANIADFDVFIFDKTGTLTNESRVVDSENITPGLWKKIYAIERRLGRKHPIALALQRYVEESMLDSDIAYISEIHEIAASGISVKFNEEKITIGNGNYLEGKGIVVPRKDIDGGTCVYVAIDDKYAGNISIRHELRPGMQESLLKLKHPTSLSLGDKTPEKTLIMLTGDKSSSAHGLNRQCGNIFKEIYAEHTPEQKSQKITEISAKYSGKKICFIGDGLNDALCSKKLRELGGVSISISSNDKAAFFTDMSLNGNLDYLFIQQEIDHQEQKIIKQNRWIMAYGAIIFLVFLISFQVIGIGTSPLIPMTMMFATTLFTLFNSYRTQVITHNLLSKHHVSPVDKIMQSNLSIGLLLGGSLALVVAVLIASLSSLHLALPLFVFGGGLINVVSSSFLVAATVMLAGFTGLVCAYMLKKCSFNRVEKSPKVIEDVALDNQPFISV